METPLLLKSASIPTPLGPMHAVADEEALYLLEFIDREDRLAREIKTLCLRTKAVIIPGSTAPLLLIETELKAYFEGALKTFKTPLCLFGTPFQKLVWSTLQKIPYGQTKSYLNQAKTIERSTACRAVANANGANQLAIVIPCHRIINSNGKLGGYGGGVARKQWLIDHEKQRL
jgi:AraC family transcriptional regulator, regulatory protein of adaptative response / methylated-DNA-[protein]-cysteine methyltransferase